MTKGASNRYGNTRGSNHIGIPTKHINFAWAKDFNKKTLVKHFKDHGKSLGFDDITAYKEHAIKFANTVDRKNNDSFVDRKTKSTYKYSKHTNEFAIIDKKGYIVTYYKPKEGKMYYYKLKKQRG